MVNMKKIKNWFRTRPLPLRFGLIGVLLCIGLFLFYLLLYFPVYSFFFHDAESDAILLLPTITGHLFPFFSHFIVEGSSLTQQFCPYTEEHCLYWMAEEIAAEENKECVSWTSEGIAGCCVDVEMSPTAACADRVEMSVFLGSSIFLVLLYFIVGAGIGFVVQKRKKK